MLQPNSKSLDDKFIEKIQKEIGPNATKVTYQGRLLPEYPALDMAPTKLFFFGSAGTKTAIVIEVKQSQILVLATSTPLDLPTLRNYVIHQVQLLIDAFCFVNGLWLQVDLRSALLEDGSYVVYDTRYGDLSGAPPGITYEEMTAPSRIDEASGIALSDFRNSMQAPTDTGLFCYRAIESLMQTFKAPQDEDKIGWTRLRSELNIDRPCIETNIKKHSDARRHGNSGYTVTGAERALCLLSTRAIIERYFRYSAGGRKTLDKAQYPLLKL